MLITAEAINTMALAYDWTHDALPEALRAKIRTAMIDHGLRPIAEDAAKGAWWTDWYHCNWGAVIFGQAGIARPLPARATSPRPRSGCGSASARSGTTRTA